MFQLTDEEFAEVNERLRFQFETSNKMVEGDINLMLSLSKVWLCSLPF